MPILRRFDPSVLACKAQLLHMPYQRLSSCTASLPASLNGASSSPSMSAFPMLFFASERYSSRWSLSNMPRRVFNCLAHLLQCGFSAQRKRNPWCRVDPWSSPSCTLRLSGCGIIPPRAKDGLPFFLQMLDPSTSMIPLSTPIRPVMPRNSMEFE